jgi:acetyltransferase-like isoleucine patch superfamily enzyme
MFRYLILSIKLLLKLLSPLIRLYGEYFNFIFPNLNGILNSRIKLNGNKPTFTQLTIFNGAGKVEIGNNCVFGYKMGGFYKGGSIEIQARYSNSNIKIGNNISTNNNIFICAANYIEIGNDTLIGQNVTLMDHEAHGIQPENRRKLGKIGTIIIGKNCWIGNNTTILKNSKIGDNSIVAVGAVVSGVFPENVVIAGVPAKIIKNL